MKRLTALFSGLSKKDDGQALPEYGLVIFFVAIVGIAALSLLGTNIQTLLNNLAGAL